VFVRLGHVLLILALLTATGGHWAVLQTVAWTNMLANNLRNDSLAVALTKTFDGENPCSMCKHISAGKKAEKKAEFPPRLRQLEYVAGRAEFVFAAPEVFRFRSASGPGVAALIHQPPVPPPRQLPG